MGKMILPAIPKAEKHRGNNNVTGNNLRQIPHNSKSHVLIAYPLSPKRVTAGRQQQSKEKTIQKLKHNIKNIYTEKSKKLPVNQ